jgi:trk system potassium uptake protein TrkH
MRNRFRSVHIVFHNLGSLLLILTGALLLPLMMILYHGHPDQHLRSVLAFAVPIVISLLGGLVLRYFFKPGNPNSIQAMLLCSLGWIVFSGIGALPYVIGIGCSYISGYFEAMSGFTTTGITMYTGLDEMPASIIFWRALTQWIGGLGILTFFLAISYRGAGAHWLFGAESHKIDVRRPVPGLAHTLAILWGIYTGLRC